MPPRTSHLRLDQTAITHTHVCGLCPARIMQEVKVFQHPVALATPGHMITHYCSVSTHSATSLARFYGVCHRRTHHSLPSNRVCRRRTHRSLPSFIEHIAGEHITVCPATEHVVGELIAVCPATEHVVGEHITVCPATKHVVGELITVCPALECATRTHPCPHYSLSDHTSLLTSRAN